jgi:hypothetical protein
VKHLESNPEFIYLISPLTAIVFLHQRYQNTTVATLLGIIMRKPEAELWI